MSLENAIKIGLLVEYVRRTNVGNRVWGSRTGHRKMGRVATGKGVFGKVGLARRVNTKALADKLSQKAKDIRSTAFGGPSEREKRLARGLEAGSKKLAARV